MNTGVYPTPGRHTDFYFDEGDQFAEVIEPAYEMHRPAAALFQGKETSIQGLHFDGGWRVNGHVDYLFTIAERSEAQSGWMTASTASIAPHFEQIWGFRKPSNTEFPNLLAGASAFLTTQGLPLWRKAVPQGTDYSTVRLSADETAYPFTSPTNGIPYDQTIPLDRVLVTNDSDSEDRSLYLYLQVIGNLNNLKDEIARIYFTASAGQTIEDSKAEIYGLGQYVLRFRGNGSAELDEKMSDDSWAYRTTIDGWLAGAHSSQLILIRISKSSRPLTPKDGGGVINFKFSAVAQQVDKNTDQGLFDILSNAAVSAIAAKGGKEYRYNIPGKVPTVSNEKVRVDLRRDISAQFNIAWVTYSTESVVVKDAPFKLLNPVVSSSQTFVANVYGVTPGTSLIDYKIKSVTTDTELSKVSESGTQTVYTIPSGESEFYFEFTLTPSAQYSPILLGWRVLKNSVYQYHDELTPWAFYDTNHNCVRVNSLDSLGPGRNDPYAFLKFSVYDPLNQLGVFNRRSNVFGRIVITDTTFSPPRTNTIWRGFFACETTDRHSPGPSGYPVKGSKTYTMRGASHWKILADTFVDTPIIKLTDDNDLDTNGNPRPYKAVNFIKSLISRQGYDPVNDFEFPDLDTRVFPSEIDYSTYVDMLTKTQDVVQSVANDYLDYFLTRDENVGTRGKWVLIPPTVPNEFGVYNNLVHFITEDQGFGLFLTHYLPGYYRDGIQYCPVDGKSPVNETVREPEGNWVQAATMGILSNKSKTQSLFITDPLVNIKSFNYLGQPTADPGSPDYIGYRKPIYVIDPSLGSSGDPETVSLALNTVALRVYQLSCFAVKRITFRAPLVHIPHETNVNACRHLRYYDPVTFNGIQYLVRTVSPSYKKDGIQYAVYELEAPRS